MPSSKVTVQVDTSRDPVAPWWHTLLVLVPLAIGSVAGWYQRGLPNGHVPGISSRLSSYITVLAQEWGVVLLIWFALKRRGLSIGSLVSGHWQTLGSFFKDLGLAVGFLVVAVPLIGVLVHFIGNDATSNVTNITPKTTFELMVWLGLAATAGFCEELTFRGYLNRQFYAWTDSPVLAILLQGGSIWSRPRILREGYGPDHGSRMASGASCVLAQEPAPRNARPRTARCHRWHRWVLLMTLGG